MDILIILTPFSGGHILLLVGAILLLFGGQKIPELMGGIGKGMKEFKKAMKDDEEPTKEVPKEEVKKEIKE
jgi:sec-independent protein translocase protein TatA